MAHKVQQQWRNDCNINTIIARAKNGQMPVGNRKAPTYGDFSNMPDFLQAKIQIQEAKDDFMSLPPKIRERFSNDPGKLIHFLSDKSNEEEAIKLGLIPEPVKTAPIDVNVINPKLPEPVKT